MTERKRLAVLFSVLLLLLVSWAVLTGANAKSSLQAAGVARMAALHSVAKGGAGATAGAPHACGSCESGGGSCSMHHNGASCGGGSCSALKSTAGAKAQVSCSGHEGGSCALHKSQTAHPAKVVTPKHTTAQNS